MTASSHGDLGDIVYMCAVLQEWPGGPHTILLEDVPHTRGITARAHLIVPLVKTMPWIKEIRPIKKSDKPDWVSGDFRGPVHHHPQLGCLHCTLLEAHASHARAVLGARAFPRGEKRWINVLPSSVSRDRIIINRTHRYQNSAFPWNEIVKYYGKALMFVGLPLEWKDFSARHGNVPYQPTTDLLEVARLIAGSRFFIGNQSVAYAITEGLKKPAILEVCTLYPDCIFNRPGVQHVYDGACSLPALNGKPAMTLLPKVQVRQSVPPQNKTTRVLLELAGHPVIARTDAYAHVRAAMSHAGIPL